MKQSTIATKRLIDSLDIDCKAITVVSKLTYIKLAIGQDTQDALAKLDRAGVPASPAKGIRRVLIWTADVSKWAEGRTPSPERPAATENQFRPCCGRNIQLNHKPGCELARVSV